MIREFGLGEFGYLVLAARWTIGLSAMAFVCGGLFGFGLAVLRVAPLAPLRFAAAGYIQFFQGTPLLMQLFLVYFGLGVFGFHVPALLAAAIAFTLYAGAFLGEIWRGCIQSIGKPQWEAAGALSLTFPQQLRYVILPQAVRVAVPPTVGFLVQLVKNTSLASIVGFVELTRAGQVINNATFQPFLVFMVVAALYFVICFPLSALARRLERRLNVGRSLGWSP